MLSWLYFHYNSNRHFIIKFSKTECEITKKNEKKKKIKFLEKSNFLNDLIYIKI